jgi:K+-sensing histidine kinase KdpD
VAGAAQWGILCRCETVDGRCSGEMPGGSINSPDQKSGAEKGFMSKILLAVSEQWTPDKRLDSLGQWANRLDAPIIAVHVVVGLSENANEQSPGERALKDVVGQLKKTNPRVESLLLFANDLVDGLFQAATEHDATMIVLGLSRQGVLERLIEGNIQRAILNNSRLPILALPPDWNGII